ncbi:MAG TPA: YceD family protein [Acidiferrobacteraceae bacterium]|nr:YceD family protein [Acidiferrobacteraceae bacterium]
MIARLMNPLPTFIDPGRLAEDGGCIVGELPLPQLGRIAAECVSGADGAVQVELHFSRDAQGRRRMRGHIGFEAVVPCARCLQAVRFRWIAHPELVWIRRGEAVPEALETAEWSEPVALAWLVEEELLLSLPMMVTHEDPPCRAVGGP